MSIKMKLLVKGIGQLVIISEEKTFLAGRDMSAIKVLNAEPNKFLALAVDASGNIAKLGHQEEVVADYPSAMFERVVDADGGSVVPGLVDGHTHPVWAGDRVHEFAMKLAGASYMEVHKAGGGINYTVERTRQAEEQELVKDTVSRLDRMLKQGTTTVECKSGYGLETETEVKMLRVLKKAGQETGIEISPTFCGAHSVPKGSSMAEATRDVIKNQLPKVLSEARLGSLDVENIDVFCEKGVFEIEESRQILEAGKRGGLRLNFHGDELFPLGGAEMGAQLGAQAISHLEEISPAGIAAMAQTGSVAVILPTTAYILRLKPPPVRAMMDAGVVVALGSDFNPNAFCLSMPLVMHLACVNLGMTLTEALVASTLNAAHSIGRGHSHGSLKVGKVADLLVLRERKWEHLIYQFGAAQDVIKHVIKRGIIMK